MDILLKRLKIFALTILGAPLLLLAPLIRMKMKKLDEQYENNPESLPKEIRRDLDFTRLDEKAYEELLNGNYDVAEGLAKKLLKLSKEFKGHWNYGNALHHANTILGLVAVKRCNWLEAKKRLNKSGKTPGSPQLDSHGPNFCLAMELLLHGDKGLGALYIAVSRNNESNFIHYF